MGFTPGAAAAGEAAGAAGTTMIAVPPVAELAQAAATLNASAANFAPYFAAMGFAAGSASISGGIAGMTLSAASSIYKEHVTQATISERIAKQIENIPDDYLRLREETIHAALSLTVDDPNKVADLNDLNGDGSTKDLVPAFDNWYYEHLRNIQVYPNYELIKNFQKELKSFADGPGRDMRDNFYRRRSVVGSLC